MIPLLASVMRWFHLVYFGIVLPIGAVRSKRKHLEQQVPLPNRIRHFRLTSFSLLMFAALSLVVAREERITVFARTIPPGIAILAGLAMYLATVAFMLPRWRKAVDQRSRVVYLFMPDNSAERAWWMVVSILAGVSEEITWRCVQIVLLTELIGNYWTAALVSAISFAFAHYLQGLRSVIIIVMFAMGFQALAWLGGSLYVAMVVHTAYDITAGLMYGKLGRQLGYTPDPLDSSG